MTVQPLDGTKMVRLGGPFTSADQDQLQDRYRLKQTFTVDPAKPVLQLNYNVFVFDYSGFDELRFNVRLTDENGAPITDFVQGGFGSGTLLKNTGWRRAFIDLSGYEGQQVHLTIDSGGTEDELYGFWAYVDAGEAPAAPVSPPTVTAPNLPGTTTPAPFNTFADPASGQVYIAIPNSVVSKFPNGCMPLDLSVPIAAGNGTVKDVLLIGQGAPIPMTFAGGKWSVHIACATSGDLAVQYTLVEGGDSETFIVPIGGIALVDPAGVIYDQATFDAQKAAGASDDQARAASAISGATVRLQRKAGGDFKNVLSGDPGISPNINPEITGANGQFQWLTSDGVYRVVVAKAGYVTTTSREVTIPPEVTDLHVGMKSTTAPQPPDADGDGVPDASDSCPNTAAATANGCPAPAAVAVPPAVITAPKPAAACAGKIGAKLAACKRAEALKKAIASCKKANKGKKKAKRQAVCIKRAKALSKCSAITGKKNAKKKKQCIAAAKRIGKPKRRG